MFYNSYIIFIGKSFIIFKIQWNIPINKSCFIIINRQMNIIIKNNKIIVNRKFTIINFNFVECRNYRTFQIFISICPYKIFTNINYCYKKYDYKAYHKTDIPESYFGLYRKFIHFHYQPSGHNPIHEWYE